MIFAVCEYILISLSTIYNERLEAIRLLQIVLLLPEAVDRLRRIGFEVHRLLEYAMLNQVQA